jgi:hypothetical protein
VPFLECERNEGFTAPLRAAARYDNAAEKGAAVAFRLE